MNKNKEYYNAIWNEIEKPKNNNVIKRKKNRIIEKAIIVICIIYEMLEISTLIHIKNDKVNIIITINILIIIILIKYYKLIRKTTI